MTSHDHLVSSSENDDQVFARVKSAVARMGEDVYNSYYEFLADNRTAESYWADGLEAIQRNTVDRYGFGREVMISVGRRFPVGSNEHYMLQELAFQLDVAANKILEAFQGPIPA